LYLRMWRMILSEDPDIAYGKLFGNRAGFVSKAWLCYFASCRRDYYDFDMRYEDARTRIRISALTLYSSKIHR
jgi:hypothetical protein